MIIDSSALIAILRAEPDAAAYTEAIESAEACRISAALELPAMGLSTTKMRACASTVAVIPPFPQKPLPHCAAPLQPCESVKGKIRSTSRQVMGDE